MQAHSVIGFCLTVREVAWYNVFVARAALNSSGSRAKSAQSGLCVNALSNHNQRELRRKRKRDETRITQTTTIVFFRQTLTHCHHKFSCVESALCPYWARRAFCFQEQVHGPSTFSGIRFAPPRMGKPCCTARLCGLASGGRVGCRANRILL